MGTLMNDIRHASRQLRRAPGFTAVVVLTLALGIGATTAIFSVVNNTVLRPMMVREIDRLVRLDDSTVGEPDVPLNITPLNIEAVRAQSTSFEAVTVQQYQPFILQGDGEPERLRGVAVSEGWLETLGIRPVAGRGFRAEEQAEGAASDAVLIGHGLWQRRFGQSPDAVGSTLLLNGRSRTVVGVLPRGFRFPYEGEVWVPLEYEPTNGRDHYLLAFGRLAEGVSLEEAQRELGVISERLAREYPATNEGWIVRATDLRRNLIRGHDRTALALLLIVGFLLLMSCVNVANLMLASSVFRQREMAIRAALGAGRRHQLRQLATESLLLAALGGAAGLLLALWLRPYLSHLVPPVMSVELAQDEIVLDLRVVVFVAGVSLLSGVLASLIPKLRSADFELHATLKEGTRAGGQGRRGRRFGRGMVAAEFGFAMTLLVGASLVVQGFMAGYGGPLGFDPERLLTLRLALPEHEYATAEERNLLVERMLRRVDAVPGVGSAAASSANPLLGGRSTRVVREGASLEPSFEGHPANHRYASPGLFRTLGIPLVAGRPFTPQDDAAHPGVVIVSRSMADRLWPGVDPLGRRLKQGGPGSDSPWLTLVGVAGDIRDEGDLEDTLYVPYAQHDSARGATELHLIVRTDGDPRGLGRAVQSAVWEIDSDLPVYDVAAMADVRSSGYLLERAGARMGSAFGLFALLLAALGVYGVIAYAVSQNRREWAVRKALGAAPPRILGSILAEASKAIVPGLIAGAAGAWAFARLLESWLVDIGTPHPAVYPALALVLGLVGLAACLGPARMASRIDPMTSLREE